MPVPPTPALLIACAAGLVANRDRPKPGVHFDPNADDAASAAFVYRAGFHAHVDHDRGDSTWPLPRTATTMELATLASRAGALRTTPAPGDIALIWSVNRAAWVHSAIVVHVVDDASLPRGAIRCRVLDPGASSTRARVTTFHPDKGDRFLRWVAMPPLHQRAA